jgi:pimeloyl-ACP methyl ester carboxylesterase
VAILAGALALAAAAPAGARPAPSRAAAVHSPAGREAAEPAPLPIGTIWDGVAAELTAWWTAPPGSNNWSCRVTKAHPYPVILVHGTFANAAFSWQALSPMLYNAGYCVFAIDYGQTVPGPFYGTAPIESSAATLAAFVTKVLKATGAKQVDMVGHSQGGLMPRYYMDFLGGARHVHMLVGLSPSNHGTSLLGITTLIDDLEWLGFPSLGALGCPSCQEQLAGSSFLQKMGSVGDTMPGPEYVVIETEFDEIVTPYQTAFLDGPKAQNIVVQEQCDDDFTDHLGMLYDPNVLADVMNALGPDSPTFQPPCVPTLPVVGGNNS